MKHAGTPAVVLPVAGSTLFISPAHLSVLISVSFIVFALFSFLPTFFLYTCIAVTLACANILSFFFLIY